MASQGEISVEVGESCGLTLLRRVEGVKLGARLGLYLPCHLHKFHQPSQHQRNWRAILTPHCNSINMSTARRFQDDYTCVIVEGSWTREEKKWNGIRRYMWEGQPGFAASLSIFTPSAVLNRRLRYRFSHNFNCDRWGGIATSSIF